MGKILKFPGVEIQFQRRISDVYVDADNAHLKADKEAQDRRLQAISDLWEQLAVGGDFY